MPDRPAAITRLNSLLAEATIGPRGDLRAAPKAARPRTGRERVGRAGGRVRADRHRACARPRRSATRAGDPMARGECARSVGDGFNGAGNRGTSGDRRTGDAITPRSPERDRRKASGAARLGPHAREPARDGLLVPIGQGERGVPLSLELARLRLGPKLSGASPQLVRRLLGVREQFLHQVDRPAIWNVGPRTDCHQNECSPQDGLPAEEVAGRPEPRRCDVTSARCRREGRKKYWQ